MTYRRLGVVTGLAKEAACLRGFAADDRLRVVCAAADADRAAAAARTLTQSLGCAGLISFGVAGGLAPGAPPGALLLPESVVTLEGKAYATNRDWRKLLIDRLDWPAPPIEEQVMGVDAPVASAARKRRLWRQTAACAIDTESHRVAQAAVAAQVPFLVIRAVADPFRRDIPPWLPATIADDGAPDVGAVAAGLARRPWQLPRLVALGLDFRCAMKTLRRVALRAGPLFFFR